MVPGCCSWLGPWNQTVGSLCFCGPWGVSCPFAARHNNLEHGNRMNHSEAFGLEHAILSAERGRSAHQGVLVLTNQKRKSRLSGREYCILRRYVLVHPQLDPPPRNRPCLFPGIFQALSRVRLGFWDFQYLSNPHASYCSRGQSCS